MTSGAGVSWHCHTVGCAHCSRDESGGRRTWSNSKADWGMELWLRTGKALALVRGPFGAALKLRMAVGTIAARHVAHACDANDDPLSVDDDATAVWGDCHCASSLTPLRWPHPYHHLHPLCTQHLRASRVCTTAAEFADVYKS